MVAELSVENIAIIERSQLILGPGFTVLTGETGAGKSLLVDAIELALGERAYSELVRTGAKSATVNVVFDLSDDSAAREKCRDQGVELEEDQLFITREVFAEGRSQCRIAGKLQPVSVLKRLGQSLVDLHGQHEHQSLLYAERHVDYLDGWIGGSIDALKSSVVAAFDRRMAIQRRLEALRSSFRDREHRLDLLRFQIGEIESVSPQHGEYELVQNRLSRLKNAEKLASATFQSLEALSERDDNVADTLSMAIKWLSDAAKFDSQLEALAQPLNEALVMVDEASREIANYAAELETDPVLLEECAARLEALKKLRRKYGDDEDEVLVFLAKCRQEVADLENIEHEEGALAVEDAESSVALQQASEELSCVRRENASRFVALVLQELADLSFDRAAFEVRFGIRPPDASGHDEIEFLFSANSGESTKPLAKIASGGELSRLMLALKGVLAGRSGVPTLIFDEVDTGLGGRVAATVGRKLEQLGRSYQVLVISHLPQVAARATTHFKIEKNEVEGRTIASVRKLSDSEREMEIARMLGGETPSEAALLNARDLLGLGTTSKKIV